MVWATIVAAALLSPGSAGPPHLRTEVWLLAGQSNMSGRGDVSELAVSDRQADGVLLYGNDGVLRPATEPLDNPEGQLDAVSIDAAAGVGPGLRFARERLRGRAGARIVLVPCAKGGSPLSAWAPSASRETLFGSCLARAREARGYGPVRGLLWYQGESDTRSEAQARAWPERFLALLAAWRSALGEPRLPVVVVSLSDPPPPPTGGRYPAWSLLQQLQRRLSAPGVVVAPAAGLPKLPDGLHLTASAQLSLGARLATAAEHVAPGAPRKASRSRASRY